MVISGWRDDCLDWGPCVIYLHLNGDNFEDANVM